MPTFLWISAAICLSAIACSILLPLTIKLAQYTKTIDYPNGRRINTEPTPRLGGIAIFGGIVIALGLLLLMQFLLPLFGQQQFMLDFSIFNSSELNYGLILLAILIVFATGLLADLFNIRTEYKLCGQILGALVAILGGVLLAEIKNPFADGIIEFGIWSYPATVLFLVAFMNIMDIIDGVDGLAAGITTIVAATLAILAWQHSSFDAVILSVIMIGVSLAFLRVNWYPARTFMGDSGSLLLGFALGLIALVAMVRTSAVISLLAPVAIAIIPALDVLRHLVMRGHESKLALTTEATGSNRIQNRIMHAGFFQRRVVVLLLCITFLLSIAAVLLELVPEWLHIALILVVFGVAFVLIWQLKLFEPVLNHTYFSRSSKPKHADLAAEDDHSQNSEQ